MKNQFKWEMYATNREQDEQYVSGLNALEFTSLQTRKNTKRGKKHSITRTSNNNTHTYNPIRFPAFHITQTKTSHHIFPLPFPFRFYLKNRISDFSTFYSPFVCVRVWNCLASPRNSTRTCKVVSAGFCPGVAFYAVKPPKKTFSASQPNDTFYYSYCRLPPCKNGG